MLRNRFFVIHTFKNTPYHNFVPQEKTIRKSTVRKIFRTVIPYHFRTVTSEVKEVTFYLKWYPAVTLV